MQIIVNWPIFEHPARCNAGTVMQMGNAVRVARIAVGDSKWQTTNVTLLQRSSALHSRWEGSLGEGGYRSIPSRGTFNMAAEYVSEDIFKWPGLDAALPLQSLTWKCPARGPKKCKTFSFLQWLRKLNHIFYIAYFAVSVMSLRDNPVAGILTFSFRAHPYRGNRMSVSKISVWIKIDYVE